MFKKFLNFVIRHKIITGLIIIVLAVGGYFAYKALSSTSAETRYVLAAVTKGTLSTSVSGTGQVAAVDQVDLKPKASGEVMAVKVESGQEVKTGTVIAKLDATGAEKAVNDAEASLESAKLSLAKLQKPADKLATMQAENAVTQAKQAKQNSETDLAKAYDAGFNAVANAFIDLPTIIAGLETALYGHDLSGSDQDNIDYYTEAVKPYNPQATSYQQAANLSYQRTHAAYDKNFTDYQTTSRASQPNDIKVLVEETYTTTKNLAEAVKNANNLMQFYKDQLTANGLTPNVSVDPQLTTLGGYITKINAHLNNLLAGKNTIQASQDAIAAASRSVNEKTEALNKLKAGAEPLDVQAQELNIEQRQNALADAEDKLADYTVKAPFDGIVAKLNVKKGDSASAGTAVATLISQERLAVISLNEVDVGKIAVGQKVTLTFDAVTDLSLTGAVAAIDLIGTATQGVVSYNVTINFDTQDDRVKPGMSVSVAIITEVKQDVLLVPSSAVKSQGSIYYVEMFDQPIAQGTSSQGVTSATPPRQQTVEVGLTNDSSTEIVSGLKTGDQIVTRTITPTAANTNASASSLFGGSSGNRGGAVPGGAMQMFRD